MPCSPALLITPGLYSDSYPGYNKDVYGSSSYRDKLLLAAAWLYRATGGCCWECCFVLAAAAAAGVAWCALCRPGHAAPVVRCHPVRVTQAGVDASLAEQVDLTSVRTTGALAPPAGQDVYQQEAFTWFSQLGGRWGASVYVSWDDVTAPAVMTLLTCVLRCAELCWCCCVSLALPCCTVLVLRRLQPAGKRDWQVQQPGSHATAAVGCAHRLASLDPPLRLSHPATAVPLASATPRPRSKVSASTRPSWPTRL